MGNLPTVSNAQIAEIVAANQAHVRRIAGELVRSLGEVMHVSRVYVFRYDDEETVSQVEEWAAPGVTPQIDNPELQNLNMAEAGFSRWLPTLRRGEIIAGPVASFPATEQPLLEAQDIKSLIVVPIEYNGKPWGFVGFDDCETEQKWYDEDRTALRAAAKLIGETLENVGHP